MKTCGKCQLNILQEKMTMTYIHHNVDGFIDQKTIKTCLWECRTCQCLQDLVKKHKEMESPDRNKHSHEFCNHNHYTTP